MLNEYNKNKTKLADVKKLLEITELNLQYFDEAGETLKPPTYEQGMPVHFGNEFNSKTENIVCKRENYSNRIILLKIEIVELEKKINMIDNILDELDTKEKYIIRKRYLEGSSRGEILANSQKHLGVFLSESTYREKKKSAEEKLKFYEVM